MNVKVILFAIIICFSNSFSQKYLEKQFAGNTSPDQLISLSPNVSFNQAINLLSKVSEKTTGKAIISTVSVDDPIGIELTNMVYDKALTILVQMKGLLYEEKDDVIVIKRKNESAKIERTADTYASVDTREVKISAVFFEADVNEGKTRGIDWKVLFSKSSLDIGGQLGNQPGTTGIGTSSGTGTGTGTGTQTNSGIENTFKLTGHGTFNVGSFAGDATAIFKFFENENLGEIIASPNITTRDRVKGRIQVGSDFSIKQKDFAGNVIENFFSTGSIIEVTPYVYNEDSVDYILLSVNVERSSFIPDPATTEVRKTSANSQVIMLNGEETIIGGLFVNDETKIRSGIPILKDLPWWVFGLRYIFGSDEIRINKKELVISIKAELVPTLKERLAGPKVINPVKEEINRYRNNLKIYQFNQQTPDDKKAKQN